MTASTIPPYFSAEFQLENPGIFYQFRIRKNESETFFAILKKGSKALEFIKPGARIPMTYHFKDKTIPAQKRETRIISVVDGNELGYLDHCLISLAIDHPETQTQKEKK